MDSHDKAQHVVLFDQALHSTLIIVAVILFIICLSLVVLGLVELVQGWVTMATGGFDSPSSIMITGLGLIVIGIAVLDLTKSIIDEEISERKQKNVQERARDFLTRFLPVIIFAISAEVFIKLAQAGNILESGIFVDVAALGIAVGAMLAGLAYYLKMTAPEEKHSFQRS